MPSHPHFLLLLVEDLYDDPPPRPHVGATFNLLFRPASPLHLDALVDLHLVLSQAGPTNFLNPDACHPIDSVQLGVKGRVATIYSWNVEMVVFELETWGTGAQIQHAYLRVPCHPGVSVEAGLWRRRVAPTPVPSPEQQTALLHAPEPRDAALRDAQVGTPARNITDARLEADPMRTEILERWETTFQIWMPDDADPELIGGSFDRELMSLPPLLPPLPLDA
ncbi:hypothetical protein C2E23DRAFT_856002 [Lenzites betulinus]|nr:hypothetical protein C2E23DRAFT_856002 [Lenzites betulinus]